MRAAQKEVSERVSVNLKMLIELAKSAKPLKHYRSKIRAARSGGHLSPTNVSQRAVEKPTPKFIVKSANGLF